MYLRSCTSAIRLPDTQRYYIVMASIVMADIAMAYTAIVYIVMGYLVTITIAQRHNMGTPGPT